MNGSTSGATATDLMQIDPYTLLGRLYAQMASQVSALSQQVANLTAQNDALKAELLQVSEKAKPGAPLESVPV